MTTNTAAAAGESLRRLYFVRFGFALVWAGLLFATASSLGPVSLALLVLYPLFDAVAAVLDARTAKAGKPIAALYANVAISLLAAAGLAVAGASGIPAVLRVWGAWAVVAGLVQLAVAIPRRRLGGQWPMIISGAISVLAGGSFIAGASAADPALTNAVGYAVPGAIFFLIAAIRLGRAAKGN